MPSPGNDPKRSDEVSALIGAHLQSGGSSFDFLIRRTPDPIFDVIQDYEHDPKPDLSTRPDAAPGTAKVNMSTGVNLGEHGEPALYNMQSVRKAMCIYAQRFESAFQAAQDGNYSWLPDFLGYLPTSGHAGFCAVSESLLFGKNSTLRDAGRICTIQTVGGTGALAVGAAFLRSRAAFGDVQGPLFTGPIYTSDYGWPNHRLTFETLGFEVEEYPYYDTRNHSVRFDDLKSHLLTAPAGSVFVLQLSGHNSSSFDFTRAQWIELAEIFSHRPGEVIPFFDAAYAGLKDGYAQDSWPLRHFADRGIDFLVAHSFSKSLESYGFRLGTLSLVRGTGSQPLTGAPAYLSEAQRVATIAIDQLKTVLADGASRALVSNCPRMGAELVEIIFTTPALRDLFDKEVAAKAERCKQMRIAFTDYMAKLGFPEFDYVRHGSVMFALLDDITPDDGPRLRELGLHMFRNRLVIPRLNDVTLPFVCKVIAQVLREKRAASGGPDLDSLPQ
ncbi:MAG: aminotransferase class I/II-fold pyridoxal phosphate-dependent enzyme [Oligoflexia bacterium]|nr:aminotransferase class I/II-fold pyridoxal phosphate-dependent enzyme [Oligoflexia bacterium]